MKCSVTQLGDWSIWLAWLHQLNFIQSPLVRCVHEVSKSDRNFFLTPSILFRYLYRLFFFFLEWQNIQRRKCQLSVHRTVSINTNIISTLLLYNNEQNIYCYPVQKGQLVVVPSKGSSYVAVLENINPANRLPSTY